MYLSEQSTGEKSEHALKTHGHSAEAFFPASSGLNVTRKEHTLLSRKHEVM